MLKLRPFFGQAKDVISRSFNYYYLTAPTLSPRMTKATISYTQRYSTATFFSSHYCCISPTYLLMWRMCKATQA